MAEIDFAKITERLHKQSEFLESSDFAEEKKEFSAMLLEFTSSVEVGQRQKKEGIIGPEALKNAYIKSLEIRIWLLEKKIELIEQ